MSSDTEHDDKASALNSNGIDVYDVIDISAIDMNDQERWLYQYDDSYTNSDVNDIRIWLQETCLNDDTNFNGNKQLIDTRTWTRPKKKLSRLSFDSITEVTSPTLQCSIKNIWQTEHCDLLRNDSVNEELQMNISENNDEVIPPMLRLSSAGSSNFGNTTTGQESLEAFFNMSQSSGVDSFINMEAPEFNETFPVNPTQSSIMSTSSSSSSVYTRDDNNYLKNQNNELIDSQILTESMMHTSIFNISEMNFNDAFAKDNANNTIIEKLHFDIDKSDNLIITANDTFTCSTDELDDEEINKTIDSTFTSHKCLATPINSKSYVLDQTFNTDTCDNNYLSYIVIKDTESNDDQQVDCLDTVDEEDSKVQLNTTFDVDSLSSQESLNPTLTLSPRHSDNSSKTSVGNVDPLESLDSTYSINENELPVEIKCKIDKTYQLSPNSTVTLSSRHSENSSETSIDNVEPLELLDSTYSMNENELPMEIKYKINKTYETSPNSLKTMKSSMKAPLSMNNQQLNSINSTFVSESRMNETYDENVPSMPPPASRYQTYRRNPMETKKKSLLQFDTTYDHNFIPPNPPSLINRYQTYRKNTTAIRQNKPTNIISSDNCSGTIDNQAKSLENLVEIKTNIQIPQKLHAPKHLSRLPQSLQKSNPNLSSSYGLKMTMIPSRPSNFGFNRQRPNKNGDPTLTSKLYSVKKLSKCDSERILDNPTINSKYSETGGSTESIDSTQSAHSAPDLNDRLSIGSDNSQKSYSRCPMNIDELQKMVQRQEESLKRESIGDRRILENNWITDETNSPSPILKDIETMDSRGSSPCGIDSSIKTSSPILSHAESIQLLNTNIGNNLTDDKTISKSTKSDLIPNKPPRIPELKSGLRQPINRNTNTVRGIPRPISRIPAPRFIRPSVKSNIETKKKIL